MAYQRHVPDVRRLEDLHKRCPPIRASYLFGDLEIDAVLFVAERLDGVQAGGPDGGDHAEEDAHTGREADADGEGPPGQRDGETAQRVNGETDPRTEEDSEDPARRGEEHRLEQKLPEDLDASGAERFADADLARPFRDADRHDAHHADAADHQRNRREHHAVSYTHLRTHETPEH